MKLKFSR